MTNDQFRRLMLMLEAIRCINAATLSPSTYRVQRSDMLASKALSDPEDEALIERIKAEGEDVDEPIIDNRPGKS